MIKKIFKKKLYKFLYNVKLKTALYSMMLLMGLIFLAVQLYTVSNYSSFINDSSSSLKSNIIKALVRERLIYHHYSDSLSVVEKIARAPLFRNSFVTEDGAEIKKQLEKAFLKSKNLMGNLEVIELRALGTDYQLLGAWQSNGQEDFSLEAIISAHKKMTYADQLNVNSYFLHSYDGDPLHMLILPIGGVKNYGFFVFITSPLVSLQGMGDLINAKVEINNLAGKTISQNDYELKNIESRIKRTIIPISVKDGEVYLNVVARYDNMAAVSQMNKLNMFSILSAIIGLLVSLYIVSTVLNISMFSRIREISDTMAKIVQGKKNVKLPRARNDELSIVREQLEKVVAYEEDRNRLNNELIIARQAADVSNVAKSEFLTNMSHELRTPLNAIIGFSEIMGCEYLANNLGDKYKEYAHDIRDSGIHLLNIINDILDLSKIEAGNMILSLDTVIVQNIVEKSVKLVEVAAHAKSISISNVMPEELPHLHVDERMVNQILINILSNAVKFTLDGGNIVINAGTDENGGFYIAISDNGIGIEESQINHVISPFSQIDDSFTREQEGTGLGLALVKSFMELHGGQVDIKSIWGAGTTVYLNFPDSCVILEKETDSDTGKDADTGQKFLLEQKQLKMNEL